jgi:hypothetical protein
MAIVVTPSFWGLCNGTALNLGKTVDTKLTLGGDFCGYQLTEVTRDFLRSALLRKPLVQWG